MHEQLKALQFYMALMHALKSPGITKIMVTLDDGELQADVVLEEKTPPSERGKTEVLNAK